MQLLTASAGYSSFLYLLQILFVDKLNPESCFLIFFFLNFSLENAFSLFSLFVDASLI